MFSNADFKSVEYMLFQNDIIFLNTIMSIYECLIIKITPKAINSSPQAKYIQQTSIIKRLMTKIFECTKRK